LVRTQFIPTLAGTVKASSSVHADITTIVSARALIDVNATITTAIKHIAWGASEEVDRDTLLLVAYLSLCTNDSILHHPTGY